MSGTETSERELAGVLAVVCRSLRFIQSHDPPPKSCMRSKRQWRGSQQRPCASTSTYCPLCLRARCIPFLRAPGLVTRSSLRSEEHTSELQSLTNLVCRLLLEKKK